LPREDEVLREILDDFDEERAGAYGGVADAKREYLGG